MSDPRKLLLGRVVAFVAREGLTDLSLRQIAEGTGTSHRMLLHHFGSRAGLLAAIGSEVERRQQVTMSALSSEGLAPSAALLRVWCEVSAPEMKPFVALFFEIVGQAMHHRPGTEAFREGLTQSWIDQARRSADQGGLEVADADLRLAIAATRGLLIDLHTGGDPDAIEAAIRRLAILWDRSISLATSTQAN